MTNPVRNKILVTLVIVLLLVNIGMICYITCCGKAAKEKPLNKAQFVAKELGLDSTQTKAYYLLRERRDTAIWPMQLELRAAKFNLIELLKQKNVPDSVVMAVINIITEKQKPIELEYYHHYRRIQSILADSQYTNFNSSLIRMIKRNTGGDNMPK